MKTEVYSWRVSSELKSDLEREARRRKTSISAIVDAAVRNWLQTTGDATDGAEQRRLHQTAAACFGRLADTDPRRAESVRKAIRQRLARHYER